MTVADILRAEPQSAHVFRKFELDPSACSHQQLETICQIKGIDWLDVKNELAKLRKKETQTFGNTLNNVLSQHEKVKRAIPVIRKLLTPALKHQGARLQEINKVKATFERLMDCLEVHLYKEEMILFPEFINLWNKKVNQTCYTPPFRMIYPLNGVASEHELVTTILHEIRELIRCYNPSKCIRKFDKMVCQELESFLKNLIKLIDLENQILFPEALMLEKAITND